MNSDFEIRLLPRERWKGHQLDMSFSSEGSYNAVLVSERGLFSVTFTYEPCEPFVIDRTGSIDDGLYADWWEGAQAFGLFVGGSDVPAGIIEVCPEEWSNRMRVTEMWVDAAYRRRGIGSALMDHAKRLTVEGGYRCLMLETQSCNAPAIGFYLSQDFEFIGFDRCCYSNRDIERGEVRLELGWFPEDR